MKAKPYQKEAETIYGGIRASLLVGSGVPKEERVEFIRTGLELAYQEGQIDCLEDQTREEKRERKRLERELKKIEKVRKGGVFSFLTRKKKSKTTGKKGR